MRFQPNLRSSKAKGLIFNPVSLAGTAKLHIHWINDLLYCHPIMAVCVCVCVCVCPAPSINRCLPFSTHTHTHTHTHTVNTHSHTRGERESRLCFTVSCGWFWAREWGVRLLRFLVTAGWAHLIPCTPTACSPWKPCAKGGPLCHLSLCSLPLSESAPSLSLSRSEEHTSELQSR